MSDEGSSQPKKQRKPAVRKTARRPAIVEQGPSRTKRLLAALLAFLRPESLVLWVQIVGLPLAVVALFISAEANRYTAEQTELARRAAESEQYLTSVDIVAKLDAPAIAKFKAAQYILAKGEPVIGFDLDCNNDRSQCTLASGLDLIGILEHNESGFNGCHMKSLTLSPKSLKDIFFTECTLESNRYMDTKFDTVLFSESALHSETFENVLFDRAYFHFNDMSNTIISTVQGSSAELLYNNLSGTDFCPLFMGKFGCDDFEFEGNWFHVSDPPTNLPVEALASTWLCPDGFTAPRAFRELVASMSAHCRPATISDYLPR